MQRGGFVPAIAIDFANYMVPKPGLFLRGVNSRIRLIPSWHAIWNQPYRVNQISRVMAYVDDGSLGRNVLRKRRSEMASIHEGSYECTKSQLDFSSVPPTQTSIESGTFVEFRPISALTDDAPIEFEWHLSQTSTSTSITVIDTSKLELTALVEQIKRRQIRLDWGITYSPVCFHKWSSHWTGLWLQTRPMFISYGPAAKPSHLTCELFHKYEAGRMD